MPKVKRHIKHQLEEFVLWVNRYGRKRTPQQQLKHQVKKVGIQAGDLGDDIVKLAKQAEEGFNALVNNLAAKPETDKHIVQNVKTKAENLHLQIDRALAHPTGLVDVAIKALNKLSQAIVTGLSLLAEKFKSIFASHPVHEKTPIFTPHHKKQNVHLQNEQSFKSRQSKIHQTPTHLKILTTPKTRGG